MGVPGSLTGYLRERTFWDGFDPAFAAEVHASIFDEALHDMSFSQLVQVNGWSLAVDVNVIGYDPRDHFDFAYIEEGWQRVQRRLESGKLYEFALAVHAIGDFYAHSLYAELAPRKANGSIDLYDPKKPIPAATLVYDFGGIELPGCTHRYQEAQSRWNGELISGQWWRDFTAFPDELENAPDFLWRRCLPDHDAIAVDSPSRSDSHRRYTEQVYREQFRWRRDLAVRHIKAAYESHPPR